MKTGHRQSVSRRLARVFALKLLYAMEITKQPVGECVGGILDSLREVSDKELPVQMKRYGMSLVDLIQEHRSELDAIISERAEGWDLDRMATLDKIVLYIALTELQYESDIPVKVAIEEAVQISKKYSTKDSPRFINGILNQYSRNKGILSSDDNAEGKQ